MIVQGFYTSIQWSRNVRTLSYFSILGKVIKRSLGQYGAGKSHNCVNWLTIPLCVHLEWICIENRWVVRLDRERRNAVRGQLCYVVTRWKITGGADLKFKINLQRDARSSAPTSLASVSVQTTDVTRVATLTVSALGLV